MNKSSFVLEGTELITSALHAQLLERRKETFEHDLKNVMHGLMSGTELLDKAIRTRSARIEPTACLQLLQQQLQRAQATLHRMLEEISPAEQIARNIDCAELLHECSHDLRHHLQRLELTMEIEPNLHVHARRSSLKDALLFVLLEAVDRAPARSRIELRAARGENGRAHVCIRHALVEACARHSFDTVAPALAADGILLELIASDEARDIELIVPSADTARTFEQTGAEQRLLIVDANRDAADSLAMLMELEGFAASVAYDAAMALQMARDAPPAAILMDADGSIDIEGLARSLREQVPTRTRLIRLQHTLEADPASAEAQLRKPVDPAALRKLLQSD